ncbi:LysR family transcriptional regulator [Stappia indica]|uniref:Transcriptional regulator, LysR family n=1 Tax=Stappia indica TaxID=538381 RepID=A0A285TGK1_9HYPH|nr:LysR family transcriptional regulator [Stappia indica]SOC19392.1 transcriptional regulator, LysR family [Stappia indica]
MNTPLRPAFDWNRLRAFLVTAEEGSLSAAARILKLTQPTLGRQVAALEQELGVALFERVGRSLSLTRSGLELLEHARAMGEAAGRVSLAASGRVEAVAGEVTVTASDVISAWLLPPVLERLREAAPGLSLEIVATNSLRDIRRREADIAIRHVEPQDGELIARRMPDMQARLYASRDLVARRGGPPRDAAALSAWPFVGFERSDRFRLALNAQGLSLTPDSFPLVSDNGVVAWHYVRAGLGVGAMIDDVARLAPEVECVLPELPAIPVPVFVVTHRELHTSRRIRIVFDHITAMLGGD